MDQVCATTPTLKDHNQLILALYTYVAVLIDVKEGSSTSKITAAQKSLSVGGIVLLLRQFLIDSLYKLPLRSLWTSPSPQAKKNSD